MNTKNNIINWLQSIKDSGCRGVVIGISGGKDSTIVAMLAKIVWGENVLGVMMPNGTQSDLGDSIMICDALDIDAVVVNINDSYNAILDQIKHIKITDKSKTNIPPRLRMTTLYAIAQSMGYKVIGTGNASERYIGWCTKFGDMACDFNPIAHLTCREVIKLGLELAEELNIDRKFIIKSPADGLTGTTDEDNFGFTYEQLDNYILAGSSGDDDIDDKIDLMNKYSQHKLRMPQTLE